MNLKLWNLWIWNVRNLMMHWIYGFKFWRSRFMFEIEIQAWIAVISQKLSQNSIKQESCDNCLAGKSKDMFTFKCGPISKCGSYFCAWMNLKVTLFWLISHLLDFLTRSTLVIFMCLYDIHCTCMAGFAWACRSPFVVDRLEKLHSWHSCIRDAILYQVGCFLCIV